MLQFCSDGFNFAWHNLEDVVDVGELPGCWRNRMKRLLKRILYIIQIIDRYSTIVWQSDCIKLTLLPIQFKWIEIESQRRCRKYKIRLNLELGFRTQEREYKDDFVSSS